MEQGGKSIVEVMAGLHGGGEKMKRCDITPGCFSYNWMSL
jgi:hypothetical protein